MCIRDRSWVGDRRLFCMAVPSWADLIWSCMITALCAKSRLLYLFAACMGEHNCMLNGNVDELNGLLAPGTTKGSFVGDEEHLQFEDVDREWSVLLSKCADERTSFGANKVCIVGEVTDLLLLLLSACCVWVGNRKVPAGALEATCLPARGTVCNVRAEWGSGGEDTDNGV